MNADAAPASVVLLHGMAQTSWSMSLLARDLERVGYHTCNTGYPTRPYDVTGLVERYVAPVIERLAAERPVHVVTHSLGGILVRAYLQTARLPAGSRIVMLAPPNCGSEVADFVRHWPIYRWWMGRVGQQLGTGADSIVHQLAPLDEEIGVIAGTRSIQPWFSWLLPGDDDGAVSVTSTRLDEMRDFVRVHASHTLMMFNQTVREQTLHFLAHGRFRH